MDNRKTFVFDIDNTICLTEDSDYLNSRPIKERIEVINSLHDRGNKIIFYTARGMGRSNNNQNIAHAEFYDLTRSQLLDWNLRYHHLLLGKPTGDIYIDDKGIRDIDFFKII